MSKPNKTARILEDVSTVQPEVPAVVVPTNEKGEKSIVITSAEDFAKLGLPSTSAKIRYLTADGYSRSAIAKYLGIRYQHVREVQLRPLKRPQAS